MTDKKLTDAEIKRALECCLCDNSECLQCQNKELCRIECDELATKTIDLITRQQAENKRLAKEVNLVSIQFQDLQERYEEAQAEIERLKQRNSVCEAANRCIVWQRDRRDREIKELHSQIAGLNIYKSKIKAEAVKEFVERIKEFMHNKFKDLDEYEFEYITERDIDNIVEEAEKVLERSKVNA